MFNLCADVGEHPLRRTSSMTKFPFLRGTKAPERESLGKNTKGESNHAF